MDSLLDNHSMKTTYALLLFGVSGLATGATVVSAKLVLGKDLAPSAKGIRTVFVAIQDPAAKMPMPCAAKKFTLTKDAEGEFLSFTLDSDSLTLMACKELPETMNLKAKLDKDGSAGPDAAGDIVGRVTGIKKGASQVTITLDKAIGS